MQSFLQSWLALFADLKGEITTTIQYQTDLLPPHRLVDMVWDGYIGHPLGQRRALESILFAQLPYDSVTDSGITGDKADVPLSEMPQYFKAKGYQALYTSGCRTDYDQWDKSLPTHGFDEMLAKDEFMKMAEQDFGIAAKDWTDEGSERRAHPYWGVHDDLVFDVLGNLLVNWTREQKARVAKNEPKKPFFVNYFMISSHVTLWDHPKWWGHYEKPNFTALYKDKEHSDGIHQYLDLRYFQDLALGKFMDRMAKEGILGDTIIVIVGDHGQAPELGVDNPEAHQQSITRVTAASKSVSLSQNNACTFPVIVYVSISATMAQ